MGSDGEDCREIFIRGFWSLPHEEDGRVYLVDPLGVTGNFEYYCHVEEQLAYESENKIWGIGVLYDRKRKTRYL